MVWWGCRHSALLAVKPCAREQRGKSTKLAPHFAHPLHSSGTHLKVWVLDPARKAEYTTDTSVSSTPTVSVVALAALMRAPRALHE